MAEMVMTAMLALMVFTAEMELAATWSVMATTVYRVLQVLMVTLPAMA